MKRALITALTVMMAGPAYAQTAASYSNAQSLSASQSRATGAIAGTQVNAPISSTSTGGTASSTSAGGTGGASDVTVINKLTQSGGRVVNGSWHPNQSPGNSSGAANTAASDPPGPVLGSQQNPLTENLGGTQTLRNVPEIIAPNISGGNPCLVGISGGGAGPGIGVTIGIGYSDKGCERRNDAAILNNMGNKAAAVEVLCEDQMVRSAMVRAGTPCQEDRPVARVAAIQPQGGIDPAIVRRQQAIPEVAAYPANYEPPKPQRPDWCDTASPAELRTHPQCN